MELQLIVGMFAALGQETRLKIFQLLAQEEDGLTAGDIARKVNVPPSSLSSHLAILAHAGLIEHERHGRFLTYKADRTRTEALAELIAITLDKRT